MDETAVTSPTSVSFAIKPGASHAGLPFAAAAGERGWEDAGTICNCLKKGKEWEIDPSPAIASGSDDALSTKTLICLVCLLENLEFWK